MRVRVRVPVSLRGLARVALCKQSYITCTLHYVRHNNDVIIDVKTFSRPFLLFHGEKGNLHITARISR